MLNLLHISLTTMNQDMCSTPFILKGPVHVCEQDNCTDQSVSPKWKGYPMQILKLKLKNMSKLCSDVFKTVTNNNNYCSNNDVVHQTWKTVFNHISKYGEESLRCNTQLRIFDKILGFGNAMECGRRCLTHHIHKYTYLHNWN